MDKEDRIRAEAELERAAFLKVVAKQRAEEEAEKAAKQAKLEVLKSNEDDVRYQMLNNGEKREKDRRDYEEEGHQSRQKIAEHRARINHIKEKKVDVLN